MSNSSATLLASNLAAVAALMAGIVIVTGSVSVAVFTFLVAVIMYYDLTRNFVKKVCKIVSPDDTRPAGGYVAELERAVESVGKRYEDATEKIAELENEITRRENEITRELKTEITRRDNKITRLEKIIKFSGNINNHLSFKTWNAESALKATVNEADMQINALDEKVKRAQENLYTEEKNNATLRGRVHPLEKETYALKHELKTLQDENAILKQKIAEDEDKMYVLKVYSEKLMCDLVQTTNGRNVVEEQLRREQVDRINLQEHLNYLLSRITGDMQRMQYIGARF